MGNGYGKFTFTDGTVWKGEWKDDHLNGKFSTVKVPYTILTA